MHLAKRGLKVLCIDQFPSPGQGSNKAAIGGLRATHSAPAKIKLCLDSLQTFSGWKQAHGDDIEWLKGGYAFVAYTQKEEKILKDLLAVQKTYGLGIDWHDRDAMLEVVPALNPEGLIGGTFSPGDGSASPMLSCLAFHRYAVQLGTECRFGERVTAIIRRKGKVVGVRTDKGGYATECLINAAGPWAKRLAKAGGLESPVVSDCHEAGITEPVARFLGPMIVDIRSAAGSMNYYFHQMATGQLLFCITPDPAIIGSDRRSTSAFLPMIAKRMVDLMPSLANLKVRRTWRGLYPMTPDGSPFVGQSEELAGYYDATGMCGQGFMLGPGVGALLARAITGDARQEDSAIFEELKPSRKFGGGEALK
jgi:sarcosine oxidase subunit beta